MIDQWGELNASQCGAPAFFTRNDRPIIRASVAAGNGWSRSGTSGRGSLDDRPINMVKNCSQFGGSGGGASTKSTNRWCSQNVRLARPMGTPAPYFEFDWPFMWKRLRPKKNMLLAWCAFVVCSFCCCVSCLGCVCILWVLRCCVMCIPLAVVLYIVCLFGSCRLPRL